MRTPCVSITNINCWMIFREIIVVYSSNHTKPINKSTAKNSKLLNVKVGLHMLSLCFKELIISLERLEQYTQYQTDHSLSYTYCVLRVKAADVMDEGRWSPLMISCHSFLLMTSTRPPRAMTRLYSSYRSKTDFAMIGNRLMGVPAQQNKRSRYSAPVWPNILVLRTLSPT